VPAPLPELVGLDQRFEARALHPSLSLKNGVPALARSFQVLHLLAELLDHAFELEADIGQIHVI
jgi:hypothetical protein